MVVGWSLSCMSRAHMRVVKGSGGGGGAGRGVRGVPQAEWTASRDAWAPSLLTLRHPQRYRNAAEEDSPLLARVARAYTVTPLLVCPSVAILRREMGPGRGPVQTHDTAQSLAQLHVRTGEEALGKVTTTEVRWGGEGTQRPTGDGECQCSAFSSANDGQQTSHPLAHDTRHTAPQDCDTEPALR